MFLKGLSDGRFNVREFAFKPEDREAEKAEKTKLEADLEKQWV